MTLLQLIGVATIMASFYLIIKATSKPKKIGPWMMYVAVVLLGSILITFITR